MTGKTRSDRGQAFTLEGLVGSIVILTAVLFALQSVVVTPTTGGSVNPETRDRLQQEADDVLVTFARNDTFGLSEQVRYYVQSRRTFGGALNPRVGYGIEQPPGSFGPLLNRTFSQRDRNYNIILEYRAKNTSAGTETITLAFQGEPSDSAVTATYPVTLYDNQTLTAPNSSNVELWQYDTNASDDDDGYYPIPNAVEGPVYNVVEVRLTVW